MTSVSFLSVEELLEWLRTQDIQTLLVELTERIEADFLRWDSFDKTPRVANHSQFGVIELMPTQDEITYGFKYVNGHPINTKLGKQTVTAFGVLSDVESGYPRFLSEMTYLTALRTAATSAMVAKHLARKDSKHMAMIGAGAQAEFQALAFAAVVGIESFAVTDTDPAAVEKFILNMQPYGFEIVSCLDPNSATAGADVITTCTADKRNAIVLEDADVAPGMHINAIGGDCPGKTELELDILNGATVFVEYEPQTRIEGEIQAVDDDFPVTEFHQVLKGQAPGRISDSQITLFDSVGFAIEDFSVLAFIEERVFDTQHVVGLDLVAEPAEAKDLFANIARKGNSNG